MKKLLEMLIIKFIGFSAFMCYTRKFNLTEEVIEYLIKAKREHHLLAYLQNQTLTESQISKVLVSGLKSVVVELVKKYKLTAEQQETLLELNDPWLVEKYLMPQEYFDAKRRFSPKVERKFILDSARKGDKTLLEVFKTYINSIKFIIQDDEMLEQLLDMPENYEGTYLFIQAKVSQEQETHIVEYASKERLKNIIKNRIFNFAFKETEQALIKKDIELAKIYDRIHKFSPEVRPEYLEALR